MYAIPILYYAKMERGISAYKMQRLLYPCGNTQNFVAKLLRPELMRFDFIFQLSGVIGAPIDVCLALLFSIYRKEAPAYMANLPAPKDVYLERKRRRARKGGDKNQEVALNLSKNSRHRFLRYLLVTKDIPLSIYMDYLILKNISAFTDKTKSMSLMTMLDIIKICAITDEPISEILNRGMGNVASNKGWLYVHPHRVDGIVPVKHFKPSERQAIGKQVKYNVATHRHLSGGDLTKNRNHLVEYLEKLLGGEGEDIWKKLHGKDKRIYVDVEEDDAGGAGEGGPPVTVSVSGGKFGIKSSAETAKGKKGTETTR
jgi:hypothetical protein